MLSCLNGCPARKLFETREMLQVCRKKLFCNLVPCMYKRVDVLEVCVVRARDDDDDDDDVHDGDGLEVSVPTSQSIWFQGK